MNEKTLKLFELYIRSIVGDVVWDIVNQEQNLMYNPYNYDIVRYRDAIIEEILEEIVNN